MSLRKNNMKNSKKILIILLIVCLVFVTNSNSIIYANEARRVYSKNREKIGQVALTFDDGPHPRYTQAILDILEEYHITATFFIIGVNATLYPEALLAISKAGCEIGNHTFTHENLKNASPDEVSKELLKCENAIGDRINTVTKLFRPPQGACTKMVEDIAASKGYDVILWSIDTEDWAHTPPEKIAENVLSSLSNGDIILMHDYISGKNTTCDALKILIPEILKRGYEFVTVSELISGESD
jgi:peptidoglycan/xylan/chitin deacetylase (PgdA/CDA1 family)